jgi:intermediate cleaving peptidase 55
MEFSPLELIATDMNLRDDDLILVDAGGVGLFCLKPLVETLLTLYQKYGGYVTDITRTWPNSGKFTPAQRDLYEIVLRVQRTCVSLCREDADMTLDKLHGVVERSLRDDLKELGFDTSGSSVQDLFPHHVGHYVGLDVHDSSAFSRKEKLTSGMCVTIEP